MDPAEPRRLPASHEVEEPVGSTDNDSRLLQTRFESNVSRPLAATQASESKGPWQSFLTVGGALSVVLGLFFGIVAIGNRTRRQMANAPAGVVQLLGEYAITPGLKGHVVRFGKRILLLTVTGNTTTRLAEISDPDEVEAITQLCNSPQRATARLDEEMRRFSPDHTPENSRFGESFK